MGAARRKSKKSAGEGGDNLSAGLEAAYLAAMGETADDTGYTVSEIAGRAGVSTTPARQKVLKLCAQGKCAESPVCRLDRIGRRRWCPGYRLLADGKSKGGLATGLDRLVAVMYPPAATAYTIQEIADRAGVALVTARPRVFKLCADGECIESRGWRLNRTGHIYWVLLYRLLDEGRREGGSTGALDRLVAAIYPPEDPGETLQEIADQAGITYAAAWWKMRQLCAQGKFTQGNARRVDKSGRAYWRVVYRLLDEPDAG